MSAGASGAIFGLIGFAIPYFRRQGSARARDIQTFMVRWALYAFFFGLIVRADNFAHAGGFAAGFLLGSVMEFREDERRRRDPFWKVVAGFLALGPGNQFCSFDQVSLAAVASHVSDSATPIDK